MTDSPEELFRRAWAGATSPAMGSRLEQMALESLAFEDERLALELRRLNPSPQAVMDLVLTGAGVSAHETSARYLGRLMTGLSSATKEVGKSLAGLQRLPERLIVAAPTPGSVRLQFRAPEVRRTQDVMTEDTESIESLAMRQVVALVIQAESGGEQLPASMSQLKGAARQSVKAVASTVLKGDWDLSGRLDSPTQGVVEFALSRQGASRLMEAAGQVAAEVSESTLAGVVDGWTWSTATMRFLPNDGAPISVVVPPEHQASTATYNADHGRIVRVKLQVVTTYPAGDVVSARRAYSLLGLTPTDEHLTFDDQP